MANETTIHEVAWLVKRHASVTQIVHEDGRVRFRIQLWDAGRSPFLERYFNDQIPAVDFVVKMQEEAERELQDV